MHLVVLVTKEGCGLCDKVEDVLRDSPSRRNYELRLSDLEDEGGNNQRFRLRIPVVLVDGVEAFEAREMDLGGLWRGRLEDILAGLGPRP